MSKQAYDDIVEGTFVEPGHDVADNRERDHERQKLFLDLRGDGYPDVVDLIERLEREVEALRAECERWDAVAANMHAENEALRERLDLLDNNDH